MQTTIYAKIANPDLPAIALVVLLTAGWNGWVRPLPPGPGFYGGSLVWFVVVLVLMLKYLPDGLWSFVDKRLPHAKREENWADAPALPTREKPAPGDLVLETVGRIRPPAGEAFVQHAGQRVDVGAQIDTIRLTGAVSEVPASGA